MSCLSLDHGRGAHAWHMADTEIPKLKLDVTGKEGAEGRHPSSNVIPTLALPLARLLFLTSARLGGNLVCHK